MNFDILKSFSEFSQLYEYCKVAEEQVLTNYNVSCSMSRSANEIIIKTLYKNNIGDIENKSVFALLSDKAFIDFINDENVIESFHFIRKKGNAAVHKSNATKEDAINVLESLYYMVCELLYGLKLIDQYPLFSQPQELPTPVVATIPPTVINEEVVASEEIIAKFGDKLKYIKFDHTLNKNDKENRLKFIDGCLTDAEWKKVSVPNTIIPNAVCCNVIVNGLYTIDNVFMGRDNKPLAILELTKSSNNIIEGRLYALKVAKEYEGKYGYKPIIYYSNGYYTYCIDHLGYESRRVSGFHTIDEMELLIKRKSIRQDISEPNIDANIAGRPYQQEAIKAICKAYINKRRRSLVVLATGTGKTRLSIALVDLLMKANWIKNVLFLADRTSLVRQAHKNFTNLLPNATTAVYGGKSMIKDPNARIIFSTYQTMISLIGGENKEFSMGRFDLIIIDEAHRSIFKKYGAIFDYFDSLMLGLTATPRDEDTKSTYDVFHLPSGYPDYAYELNTAVDEGFLVGFAQKDRTTDFLRRGFKYSDLTEEQKSKYEENYEIEDYSKPIKLNGKKINIGTIDSMINDFMGNGLKVDNGDKIGKTIVFAKSHLEATIIVERFNKMYPGLGDGFCKVIDSTIENNQELIDHFEQRDSLPQIAVSVDMLDTGIDVPDILNLVFFKPVHSKIKYLQMIGRGTRLSKNVFGPGEDKKGFFVFDYYDNFRYFDEMMSLNFDMSLYSLTMALNRQKLEILKSLQFSGQLSKYDQQYKEDLQNYFVNEMLSLVNCNVAVQTNMNFVNKYRIKENWNLITDSKFDEIVEKILPLIPSYKAPVETKQFDLSIYVIMSDFIEGRRKNKPKDKIISGLGNVTRSLNNKIEKLITITSIPAVLSKRIELEALVNGASLFNSFSIENTEKIRKSLRDVFKYLPSEKDPFIFDIMDKVYSGGTISGGHVEDIPKTYRQKVEEYLLNDKNLILIKIRSLEELDDNEFKELQEEFFNHMGTEASFKTISGGLSLLAYIRRAIGIDDGAIKLKFGSFLNKNVLTEEQYNYCMLIVDYVKMNGDITMTVLGNEEPFASFDFIEIFDVNKVYAKKLVDGFHKPIDKK